MKPYRIADSYHSQIEASALIGLRVGYTTLGIALWPPKAVRRPRLMPRVHLAIWAHTGQCDQRWVFRLKIGRHQFGYLTWGDATPDLWRYSHAGWYLS